MASRAFIKDEHSVAAGELFLKRGVLVSRAYLIEKGLVRSFIEDDKGNKLEVGRYGPGDVIGEMSLVLNMPIDLSYEAIQKSILSGIDRRNFEQKIKETDSAVVTVLKQVVQKVRRYENIAADAVAEKQDIDLEARLMVKVLLSGLVAEKKKNYEEAILPHMSGMLKAIKAVKQRQKIAG